MKQIGLILLIAQYAMCAIAQSNEDKAAVPQSEFECLYEYKVTNTKSVTDTYTTILQIGRDCSCFMDYTTFQSDSVNASPGSSKDDIKKYQTRKMKNSMFFDQTVLQNHPQGEMSVYSVIPPNDYMYKEKLHGIQWSLGNETDTICGYVCKQATGEYGGRKWIVWYAPEIPSTFGPWKFCGLPGLVMLAYDTANIHRFEAIAFRKSTLPMFLPDIANIVKTERDKFIKSKNKYEENPMNNIPIESISNMTVIKDDAGGSSILVNGVQIRLRPNGYTPLELE